MTATYFTDAITELCDTLDDMVGVSVTYSRGTLSATVIATIGETIFESDTEFGVLRIESRDYLITKSRLDDAGFGEPQRGDRITETQGDEVVTYEVLDRPGAMPFRYCDSGRARVRVHTTKVDKR